MTPDRDAGPGLPRVLEVDAFGRLVLTDAAGRRFAGVEPIRSFPLTDPDRGIALVDADGRERAWIEDVHALDPASRSTLAAELDRRAFLPVIHRIVRGPAQTPPAEWEVVTDRGPARFTLRSEDDLRPLGPGRVLIVDAHGLRYLIPDVNALPPRDRRLLERYL